MRYVSSFALTLAVLLIDFPALAQIGTPYPGGYPPGGYPPGQYPGGRRGTIGGGVPPIPRPGRKGKTSTKDKDTPEPLVNVTGMLRRIDDTSVVVEAQDTRIINLKRTEKTRFLKDSKEIKPAELKPGDHLMVESKQDEQGFLFAVNVIFQKEGTAEERAAASEPVEVLNQTPQGEDERPVLRKKDQPAPETETQPAKPAGQANQAEEADAAPAPRPTIIRPLPQEEEQPVPVLRHKKPGERKAPAAKPAPRETASARPPETAPEPAPQPAAEPVREEVVVINDYARPKDPVIEKTRAMAGSFTESLPNYYCQQFVARFVNQSHKTDWQPLDIVSSEVIYEKGRERYRNVAINGKLTKKSMEELPGAWSTGEFGTMLVDLFSPTTAAEFEFAKEDKAAGLPALVYDFYVEREHSHWHVYSASQSVTPAYKGSIWIDRKTHRILRIEMQAREMPREFPLDKVESAVDYQFIRLGGEPQFLLPVHAESLSCQRGTNLCSRNQIDFRNYHKYTSDSTIIFNP